MSASKTEYKNTLPDTAAMAGNAQDNAFLTDDLDKFIRTRGKKGNNFPSRKAAEIAFHKMRYEARHIPAEKRHASRVWLETRGFSRWHKLPWPPVGELPR